MRGRGAAWDSVFLAAVRMMGILVSLIQTRILSSVLSLADYGSYAQAMLVVSMGASAIMLGFGDGVNYFFNHRGAGSEVQRQRYVNALFALESGLGLICAGVMAVLSPLWAAYFDNPRLKGLLMIVAIKPLLENWAGLYQVLFVSVGRARLIAIKNFVLYVVKLLVTVVAVCIVENLELLLILWVFMDGIQCLWMTGWFEKTGHHLRPAVGDWQCVKTILTYCLPMGVFAMTQGLTREMDKLVIGRMGGTELLAIYANCSKILPFDIVPSAFATVLIPHMMRYLSTENHEKAIVLFKNYLKIGAYTVWIMGGAVLVTHRSVIDFLYSERYLSGRWIFVLYVLDSMIRFAGMHLILTSGGQAKYLMGCSLGALVANGALNVIFYRWMGPVGPAVATLCVAVGYVLVIMKRNLWVLRARWSQVIDIRALVGWIAELSISAVALAFLRSWLMAKDLHEMIVMFMGMIIYAGVNFLIIRKRLWAAFGAINGLKREERNSN